VTSGAGECARCKNRDAKARGPSDEAPASGPLPELDRPAPPPLVVVPAEPAAPAAPRADVATGTREAAPPPKVQLSADAARLLAAYGLPPKNPLEAVPYALRVHSRLAELRAEREKVRAERPHEVPLYDVALTVYDETGYTAGLAILGSLLVLVLLLLLAPLVLAAMRALGA